MQSPTHERPCHALGPGQLAEVEEAEQGLYCGGGFIPDTRDESGGRFRNVDKRAVGRVLLIREAWMSIRSLHRKCTGMEIASGPKERLA